MVPAPSTMIIASGAASSALRAKSGGAARIGATSVVRIPIRAIRSIEACTLSVARNHGREIAGLSMLLHRAVYGMHDRPMQRLIALAILMFGAGCASADEAGIVQSVYTGARDQLLWSVRGEPSRQARELLGLVARADSFGLRPGDYGMDPIIA